jgi:long-chain acyl-CoA synthetase
VLDAFRSLASKSPHAIALIDGTSSAITTREALMARATDIAARLEDSGLREGDLYALQLPNSVDFVATFLAALKLRLVVVPIDRDAPESEVAAIRQHFGIGTLTRATLPTATRLVKLTSGSTGKPKGVVTTEANLVADCRNICASMNITPDDVNLGAIPFSHSYGFSNLVMPLVVQGTPIVFTNDYLPQSLLDLANRYRCTVAPLIPMVYAHLASTAHGQFETVRTFISAGAPLPARASRHFRERFGIEIHSFYGCSECGGITYDRSGGAVERGTVGAPLDGVTVSTDGARLSVCSESVAAGYLHDAATFQPIEQGTFVTDDLVEMIDGELTLTGRASDMINTAGKKVNPREVEAVILEIEGVREARVYGEAAGARGEVVAAAIVATPEVTREQVREFCRARLSLHKVPRIVKLIDAMPLDERGKIRRAALTAL